LSPTHRVLARPEVNVLGLTIAERGTSSRPIERETQHSDAIIFQVDVKARRIGKLRSDEQATKSAKLMSRRGSFVCPDPGGPFARVAAN